MPSEQLFINKLHLMRRPLCTRPTRLVVFYSANSLKQVCG